MPTCSRFFPFNPTPWLIGYYKSSAPGLESGDEKFRLRFIAYALAYLFSGSFTPVLFLSF
jgi:hypothetical protein